MRFLKSIVFACCLVATASCLASFSNHLLVKSVFDQLGITREEASEDIQSSLLGGYVFARNAPALRKLSTESRVQVVREISAYAKEYVNSAEFRDAYLEERENNKPLETDYLPENMSVYPAEEQAEMRKAFKESLAEWELHYPKDSQAFIKRRLQEFLDLTADVDFSAALKPHPYHTNKKIFVNSVYEAKPEEWKKAFRAGKDATLAARLVAQQWIRESP